MGNACSELASEMRWRLRTILRAKRYHSTVGMMQLYKSKVLSYAEYRTAAIYHACDTALKSIEHVQHMFLEELAIDELVAFTVFNLAPLKLRRDIAILGVIHRNVPGHSSPCHR